jgi:hypothetical protein
LTIVVRKSYQGKEGNPDFKIVYFQSAANAANTIRAG